MGDQALKRAVPQFASDVFNLGRGWESNTEASWAAALCTCSAARSAALGRQSSAARSGWRMGERPSLCTASAVAGSMCR